MVQKSGSAPAASSADYMDYRIVNVADQSDVPGGVAAADISVREDDTVPTPEGECKDLEMADPGQSLEEDRDAIVGSSLIILFLLTIMIFVSGRIFCSRPLPRLLFRRVDSLSLSLYVLMRAESGLLLLRLWSWALCLWLSSVSWFCSSKRRHGYQSKSNFVGLLSDSLWKEVACRGIDCGGRP